MTTFIRKGEHIPRSKVGCKKGYYPERHLNEPKRGFAEGSTMFSTKHGTRCKVTGKTKDGYRQVSYVLPITAPVHRSEKGKLYSAVFHKWKADNRPTKKSRTTVFDKSLRVAEDNHPTKGLMGVKFEDHWELKPKPIEDDAD